jgi:hypothetical protein
MFRPSRPRLRQPLLAFLERLIFEECSESLDQPQLPVLCKLLADYWICIGRNLARAGIVTRDLGRGHDSGNDDGLLRLHESASRFLCVRCVRFSSFLLRLLRLLRLGGTERF